LRTYEDALVPAPFPPDTSGIAVAADGRVVGFDLYSSPRLFRAMWPQLMRSYVLDLLDKRLSGRWTSPRAVRLFLDEAAAAPRREVPNPTEGLSYVLFGRGAHGNALVVEDKLVHAMFATLTR